MIQDNLKRITDLAKVLVEQRKRLDEAEAAAKQAKADYLRTEREDLPSLMTEACLAQLKLDTGEVISVVSAVDAAITEANREEAMQWLADHGFGGLVKTEVSVRFDRGDYDAAQDLHTELQTRYGDAAIKQTVHPSTLRAFVNEQLQAGNPLPMDLFGVRPYDKATIKQK